MSVGLLVALVLLMIPDGGPRGEAIAWGLPNRGQQSASARTTGVGREAAATGSPIQEVAPPPAVLQLSEALAERQPRVRIVEPADGALLPDGPWTLRLQVEDWPLVDAGALGLGPHLLVQIDDAPPTPLLATSLNLPPLSPGSHRLTVMAARPWGEVVKRPGAFHQIRLNRIAANPLGLPAPGTPQLLATAPLQASRAEPVLLDWLLIDAPLQHLRADDARWRLRISVNGDSFLVDQATPLWLKGWQQGSNALLLELVDGQGEPLNPPFNSLVREIRLQSEAPRPAWLGGKLGEADLAQLLGQQPAVNEAALPEPASPPPATETVVPAPVEPAFQESAPVQPTPLMTAPLGPVGNSSSAAEAVPEQAAFPEASPPEQTSETPSDLKPAVETRTPPPDPTPTPNPAAGPEGATAPVGQSDPTALAPAAPADPPAQSAPGSPDPLPAPAAAPEPTAVSAEPPDPLRGVRPAARDEVNPDGTLIRPGGGPLQALRERLKR